MRTATRLTICLLCLFASKASADPESAPAQEKLAGLEMVIQTGHLRTVRDLAFSGDSRYILSGSGDKTMKLWDAESGALLRTFHCESVVDDVAFVPDGRRVMSYDDVGGIVVWDRVTGKKLQTIATERGQGKDLFVLSDGRTVVFGHGEDTVEVWDIDTHKRLKRFTNRCNIKYSWMSLSLLSDEKRMLTTCRDGTVKLWDLDSGRIHWTSRISKKELGGTAVATPDMRYVFSGRRGGYPGYPPKKELLMFDLGTGKLKRSYDLKALIHNIVPLPDNRRLMIMLGPPRDGGVVLFDFEKGKVLRTYENACDTHSFASDLMGASPNMRQFVVPDEMSNLRTWDIETGETVHTLGGKAWGRIAKVSVPDTGWQVAAASWDGNTYVWNALSASLIHALPGTERQWATSVLYSPDGRFIAAEGFTNEAGGANDFRVWNARTGELIKKVPIKKSEDLVAFLPDGRLLTRRLKELVFRDIPSWTEVRTVPADGISSSLNRFALSPDLRRFITVESGHVNLWDFNTGKHIRKIDSSAVLAAFLDNTHVLTARSGCYQQRTSDTCAFLELWDIETGEKKGVFEDVKSYLKSHYTIAAALSLDGSLVASGTIDGYLDVWNVETGEQLHHYEAHAGSLNQIAFLPSGRHVATGGEDGTVQIWNVQNGHHVGLVADGAEWIAYTKDGYFDASRRGGSLITGVVGMQSYRVDQLAFRFNRPDILLERLELESGELVSHYRSLFERRLKKFGLSEQDLKFAFNRAPDAKILSLRQEGKRAELTFELKESGSELLRYNVYVNDVPLFGADGKAVSGTSERITETVELTYGRNKIEISALNKLGIESLRDHRIAEYSQKVSGDLYYLGFGVSKYADEKLNLKYASKDALDLEAVLKRTKGVFNEVHTRVFSDADVTRDAFHQAKMFLAGAGVDDTVVLFVAGHGVYDAGETPQYYYLTHKADLSHLEKTAARFELIEELLQHIKPRNKLFLLDTCQSGELSAGEEVASLSLAKDHKLIGRGIQRKHLSDSKRNAIRKAFFDQNRYIYNDLFRRSGAIVLSSSQGAEWSYESDAIENGVFTEEVIRALTSKSADENRDRLVTTEELRDYVTRAVAEKTAGLQHPVVDRDNLENVFALPVVRR